MKTLLRFLRSGRNRRRHSRIPLLGESLIAFNQLGDTLFLPVRLPVRVSRPVLAPCFMRHTVPLKPSTPNPCAATC